MNIESKIENRVNCSKLGVDMDILIKRSKYDQPPRFKVGQKDDNNKKAGSPQQLKTNYCGPLDTKNT